MALPRRSVIRAAQLLVAAIVVVAAAVAIGRGWGDLRPSLGRLSVDWGLIALSSGIVLATYVLLAEVWRAMVSSWGSRLAFGDALRIWFVSNLGKYVPGKVWQIGAMGVLAERAGVSPAAAIGSSLVINLVNILTGFAVTLVAGSRAVEIPGIAPGTARALVATIAVVGLGGLLAVPSLLPWVGARAGKMLGRDIPAPAIPRRAIVISMLGTGLAWVTYGIAFAVFVHGIIPGPTGATSAYVAVYTGSYLVGYLALLVPGGFVVRESTLVLLMPRFGLADAGTALVIAAASRLWLTVLEVLPGLFYLARGGPGRPIRTATQDAAS